MQFFALVEEWPNESIVFFRELPGCFSSAPTTEAALVAAPEAIAHYFRWLKENDIVIVEDDINPISVVVKERLNSLDGHAGPFFEADRAAPDDLEIDNALNVAATARALIIEFVAHVPAALHDQSPSSGDWSLTQHLQHIMESEAWYVSRLQEHPPKQNPAPLLNSNTDDISMKIFENAMDSEIILRDLLPEQRTRTLVHEGEEWSAAKVLRRMAEHLREHYPWMEEIPRQLSAHR